MKRARIEPCGRLSALPGCSLSSWLSVCGRPGVTAGQQWSAAEKESWTHYREK